MGTARRGLAGCGIQTAALAFGGNLGPGQPMTAATEEYDGSTWTASTSMTTARRNFAGCGTQTAGLGAGGYTATAVLTNTEEYTDPTFAVQKITTS